MSAPLKSAPGKDLTPEALILADVERTTTESAHDRCGAAEEAVWRESPTSSYFRAANDDFIEVNEHLNYLQKKGARSSEITALLWTVVVSTVVAMVFYEKLGTYSRPTMLFAVFIFSFIFFLLLSNLIRQRLTLATLTKILRTTAHLTQPEKAELQRLALIPGRFQADVTSLNLTIDRTGERVGQIVASLHVKFDEFEKRLSATQIEVNTSLENISLEHAAIVTNGENLRHALKNTASDASNQLATIASSLQTTFQTKCTGMIEVIDERNREFIENYLVAEEKTLKAMQNALNEALTKQIARCLSENNDFFQSFSTRIAAHTATLGQQIDQSVFSVGKIVSKSSVDLQDIFSKISQETEELLERVNRATDDKSTLIKTMVAETILGLSKSFRENHAQLDVLTNEFQGLISTTKRQEEQLTSQIGDFKSAVVDPLQFLSHAFGEKSRSVANDVSFQITSFNEAASAASAQLEARFVEEAQQLEKTSNRSVLLVRNAIKELETECETAVERLAISVNRSVDDLTRRISAVEESKDWSRPINAVTERIVNPNDKYVLEERAGASSPSFSRARRPAPGQSWLSEMLARVDEVDEREARLNIEPEALEKIAPMLRQVNSYLKPLALSSAWNTFKEKNSANFDDAFTNEGRIAIRSIKTRLDEDCDLASHVESYLTKVEDLLREAYAANDDSALLSYMVSTPGKVYTILAYASERI